MSRKAWFYTLLVAIVIGALYVWAAIEQVGGR